MLGFAGTREWVEAQSVTGTFTTIRRWTFFALHLILFVTPWIPIGGHPAIRVDLPHRQVFAFGNVYTAADTIFLLIILLFLAFSLFFFTSLFGRLWCGYACPQTVFLETWIRPIEQWIEGDRSRRLRRRRQGFTFDLVWRRALKWTVFAVVAFVVAMAFVSYFAGARDLWTGHGGPVEYSIVAFFSAVFFLDFAWFREQFCNYLCPYARFQGRSRTTRRSRSRTSRSAVSHGEARLPARKAGASTAGSASWCARPGSTSGTGSSSSASPAAGAWTHVRA